VFHELDFPLAAELCESWDEQRLDDPPDQCKQKQGSRDREDGSDRPLTAGTRSIDEISCRERSERSVEGLLCPFIANCRECSGSTTEKDAKDRDR
jgi:hypothetical protein